DPEPLTLGPITEFSIGSLSGTTLSHTESVIEIPFSEDVSQAGGESGALTLADNVTVSVDGTDVTGRYTLDDDGSADGQVILTSGTPVAPGATVTVAIDAVNDSVNTETITPGTVDATVTDATVVEGGGEANAFEGETVAFVATDGTADLNQAFEVAVESGAFVFAGETGAGSQTFAFDTGARNWSGTYEVATYLADGSLDERAGLGVRALGLSVAVADRNLTTADAIEGAISANAGGREVAVRLRDDDGDVLGRTNETIGGDGAAGFAFGERVVAAAGPGNYTVNVTDRRTATTAASERLRVVDAAASTAEFGAPLVGEHAGDVVAIDVELTYADTATVTVGSPAVGFRANATVVDGDGDGTVRLRFNTAAVARASSLPADGGEVFDVGDSGTESDGGSDSVVAADVDDLNAVDAPLDAGEYELRVRPGAAASDPATAIGTLALAAPVPTRLTTWTAPAGSTFDRFGDVAAAEGAGRLTATTEVAVGDVVVHRIVVPGLAGEFARRSGTATETFFALAGRAGEGLYTLNVTQTDAATNEEAYRLDLDARNTRVVADPGNDTYVVVYDSGNVTGVRDQSGSGAGDALSAAFTVHENRTFTDLEADRRTVSGTYALVAAAISTGDPVVVAADANQTISGVTSTAPGTEVAIRVRATNGTATFLRTAKTVVARNGSWSVTFDFSARRVGDTFRLTSAVASIASAAELDVAGTVRAVLPVTTMPVATQSTPASGGGSSSGGGAGWSDGDSGGTGVESGPEPTATPEETPTPSAEQTGGSVLDSTGKFVNEVFARFGDDSSGESLRSRVLQFDALVVLTAIAGVVVYFLRRD
ncbi:MAG: BGTF surface domain-containing protein, partial [Haloquadratum sp.]